jgi:hypothetical protein
MWIEKNCEEIDNMMKYNQQDKAYKLIKRYFNEKKAILGLRVILEKQIDRQKIIYMAFIDLEKAFDSINWTSLFKILEETEIDFKDRRILYKIYEEQEAIININTTTVTAKIQKVVKQGCPLSPALFNVFIEKAINVIKLWLEQKGIGVKIGGVLITMLRFADDIVVLATSEEDFFFFLG